MTPKISYVTKEECDKKTHIPKWMFLISITIFLSVMAIFMVLVEYSGAQANAAATQGSKAVASAEDTLDRAEEVASSLKTHILVEAEKDKAVVNKLEDIRRESYEYRAMRRKQDEIRRKQDDVLRLEQREMMKLLIKMENQHSDTVPH